MSNSKPKKKLLINKSEVSRESKKIGITMIIILVLILALITK